MASSIMWLSHQAVSNQEDVKTDDVLCDAASSGDNCCQLYAWQLKNGTAGAIIAAGHSLLDCAAVAQAVHVPASASTLQVDMHQHSC
jgi:hypothetical protein